MGLSENRVPGNFRIYHHFPYYNGMVPIGGNPCLQSSYRHLRMIPKLMRLLTCYHSSEVE